jgi:hypothetical protein
MNLSDLQSFTNSCVDKQSIVTFHLGPQAAPVFSFVTSRSTLCSDAQSKEVHKT